MRIQQVKAQLRREMRRRLSCVPPGVRASAGRAVCARVLELADWRRARTVMLFSPLASEIDIWPLAEAALSAGKRLCLPGYDPATGGYRPREIRNLNSDLRPGPHGIQEPSELLPWISPAALDFVLVPGLAYDARGGRLGRGRGHYDRLLATAVARSCGVGYDSQLLLEVPMEPHDVKLNAVLTPGHACECAPRVD